MSRQLRAKIGHEEFDYLSLMNALSDYANPREKVTSLIKQGEIIRVKKGLYIFGEHDRLQPYSKEYLANMILGPSYLSFEYALSYYGFIPERVTALTSVSMKRQKSFTTPVGQFQYRHTSDEAFSLGFTRVDTGATAFLIATREKAVYDQIKAEPSASIQNAKDMEAFLFENLRIEPKVFFQLDPTAMKLLDKKFASKKISLCYKLFEKGIQ